MDAYTLRIAYKNDDTETTRRKLEALCEGLVRANVIERSADQIPSQIEGGIVYEEPRVSTCADQTCSTSSVCAERGRATCMEAACDLAAALRLQGVHAVARIVQMMKRYGDTSYPDPFRYHAVVECPETGSVYDPTALLEGADHDGDWLAYTGHCCPSCALNKECDGDEACEAGDHT